MSDLIMVLRLHFASTNKNLRENDPTESGMKLLINALKNEGGGVHFFSLGFF